MKLKLSKQTIDILKNYSSIYQSIYFNTGNQIHTVSLNRTLKSVANIEETFPEEFGVYDLPAFLSVINLFQEPELEFKQTHVTVSGLGNTSQINFYYTSKDFILVSDTDVVIPDENQLLSFDLTQESLFRVQKASAILNLEYVKFETVGDDIVMSVVDLNQDIKNSYSSTVGESKGVDLSVLLKSEYMMFLNGDYNVIIGVLITGDGEIPIIKLTHKDIDLEYFIALDIASEV